MNKRQRKQALALARALMPRDEFEKVCQVEIADQGLGYDPFGLEKESAILAFAFARYAYHYWFRVESHGHEHVPLSGRALITPNHSGVLPIDGAMIAIDLVLKLERPRLMRAMVDHFMGFLPFLNTLFYRVGQMVGARRNFADLLQKDELVTVFPEGAKGTGKLFSQRYKLRKFNVGFIELALTYKTPIIPMAVIGAEEQAPMLYNVRPLARALKFPYFPITPFFPALGPLGFLPLPVKYHLYYGEPLHFYQEYPPEAARDAEIVRTLAGQVQRIVQRMIEEGLEKRDGLLGFGGL